MSMPMETITSDAQLNEAGFYWREIDGVRALICAPLEEDGFVNGFSTRLGGVSEMPANALSLAGFNEDAAENILENRRRFLKLFPGERLFAGCWQVHGVDVRVVQTAEEAKPKENERGESIYCDVIVSNANGDLAGGRAADCVLILLYASVTHAFDDVTSGW